MVQGWTRSRSTEDQANSLDADVIGKGNHEKLLGYPQSPRQVLKQVLRANCTTEKYKWCERSLSANSTSSTVFPGVEVILGKDIKLPYFSSTKAHNSTEWCFNKRSRSSTDTGWSSSLFASRILTPIGEKYQNLECEALAIIWSMGHFSYFLFGEEFTLETDQKPLVRIYEKVMDDISPRITRIIYHSLVFRPLKVLYFKGRE